MHVYLLFVVTRRRIKNDYGVPIATCYSCVTCGVGPQER